MQLSTQTSTLQPIQSILGQQQFPYASLTSIIQRCTHHNDLDGQEIKGMFEIVSICIQGMTERQRERERNRKRERENGKAQAAVEKGVNQTRYRQLDKSIQEISKAAKQNILQLVSTTTKLKQQYQQQKCKMLQQMQAKNQEFSAQLFRIRQLTNDKLLSLQRQFETTTDSINKMREQIFQLKQAMRLANSSQNAPSSISNEIPEKLSLRNENYPQLKAPPSNSVQSVSNLQQSAAFLPYIQPSVSSVSQSPVPVDPVDSVDPVSPPVSSSSPVVPALSQSLPPPLLSNSAQNFISPYCHYYKLFSFNLQTLKTSDYCRFTSWKPIRHQKQGKQAAHFTITESSIFSNYFFGIADKSYQKQQFFDSAIKNWVILWNNGQLYISGKDHARNSKTKTGFSKNKKVTVQVELWTGTVRWYLDGKLIEQVQHEMMQNREIQWIFVGGLGWAGDCVSIQY